MVTMPGLKYSRHTTLDIFSSSLVIFLFVLSVSMFFFFVSTIVIEILTLYLLQEQGTPPLKKFGSDSDELRKSIMEKQRVCSFH